MIVACRDDVLSWATRRSGARSIAALQDTLRVEQLETCISLNAKGVMDRYSGMRSQHMSL